jgi:peptidoglycan/LPS O-acetylase OafA/YrhL
VMDSALEEHRAAKSARYYRPELDMLRLLAVALVFQYHLLPIRDGISLLQKIAFAWHKSGACGVCLFFMLSAFLISELLLREIETTGTVHIRSFYVRRVLRIWPLFLFFLLIVVISSYFDPGIAVPHSALLAFLFMGGNWYWIFHGPPPGFMTHLWSISLEEQFYLMWPTLVKFTSRRGILILSVLFGCGAFIALPVLCAMKSHGVPGVWANSFVQFQFFAAGGLLALWLHHRTISVPKYARPLLFIAGISALTEASYGFHIMSNTVSLHVGRIIPAYLCVNTGRLLLFFSFYGMSVPRWCKGFVYLGKISYGLYVFHPLAGYLISRLLPRFHPAVVLYLLLTIAMAMLSYHFLESPFLRLKNRFTYVRSRAV